MAYSAKEYRRRREEQVKRVAQDVVYQIDNYFMQYTSYEEEGFLWIRVQDNSWRMRFSYNLATHDLRGIERHVKEAFERAGGWERVSISIKNGNGINNYNIHVFLREATEDTKKNTKEKGDKLIKKLKTK